MMSKTWRIDSEAANHLNLHHFIRSCKHAASSRITTSRMVVCPDDRGVVFGSRAWNKHSLRSEWSTTQLSYFCSSRNSQIISPVCFPLSTTLLSTKTFPTTRMYTCAQRKSHFPILIFNSVCDAYSGDLVLHAVLPAAWLHAPLAGQAAAFTALV